MSPRFVRNLAGVVTLTGLALTLACGGNDAADPINPLPKAPSTPVVDTSRLSTVIAKHGYSFNAISTDPQGEALTYMAYAGNAGSKVTANPQTSGTPYSTGPSGLFSYIPAKGANDFDNITVKVTNAANLSAQTAFQVKVVENRAPELAWEQANVSLRMGESVVVSGLPKIDPDGDNVTWRLLDDSKFVTDYMDSITMDGGYAFVVNAAYVPAGNYTFNLEATESGNGLVEEIRTNHQVRVTVGLPGAPLVTDLREVSGKYIQGHEARFQIVGNDPANRPLTYTATVGGTNPGTIQVVPDPNGIFTWRAAAAGKDATTITFTVTANNGAVSSPPIVRSFAVAANRTPVLPAAAAVPIEIPQGTTYNLVVDKFDADGDQVTWAFGSSTPAGVTATQSAAGAPIVFTVPQATKAGDYSVKLNATEVAGINDLYAGVTTNNAGVVTIKVTEPAPPTIVSVNPVSQMFFSHTTEHTHKLIVNATDPSAGTLAYSGVSSLAGSTITASGNTLSWVPINAGTENITVTVKNPITLKEATQVYPHVVHLNTWPDMPHHLDRITVKIGEMTGATELPLRDHDGDTITWAVVEDAGYTDLKTDKGDVVLNAAAGTIRFDATKIVAAKTYTINLKLQESGNGLPAPLAWRDKGPTGTEYKVTLVVNDKSNPQIDSVVQISNLYMQHVTEHMHKLRVTFSDPENAGALKLFAESSYDPGKYLDIQGGDTVIWTPKRDDVIEEGNEEHILIWVQNDTTENESDEFKFIHKLNLNTWPDLPYTSRAVNVHRHATGTIAVPDSDTDGDAITWAVIPDGETIDGITYTNDFLTDGGEVKLVDSKTLKFFTEHIPDAKLGDLSKGPKTYQVALKQTETGNALTLPLVHAASFTPDNITIGTPFTVTVSISQPELKPANTRIDAFIDGPAVQGFPKKIMFSGQNLDDQEDLIESWEFATGKGSQNSDPINKGFLDENGNENLTWDSPGQYAEGYFTPLTDSTDPDYISTGSSFLAGIRAHFISGAIGYQSFLITVKEATPITVDADDIVVGTTAGTSTTMNVPAAPWTPKTVRESSDMLVLQAAEPGSLPLTATVAIGSNANQNVKITSPDLANGLVSFKIELVDAKIGTTDIDKNVIKGWLANHGNLAHLTTTTPGVAIPGNIVFNTVPLTTEVDSTFAPIAGEDLVLTYEIYDKDGKVTFAGGGLSGSDQFTVTIALRENTAPVIDNGTTPPTKGDSILWLPDNPGPGIKSTWTLGDGSGAGAIGDAEFDKVHLTIVDPPDTDTLHGGIVMKAVPPGAPGWPINPWKLEWTPGKDNGMQPFSFTLRAYDVFGAASEEFEMRGNVWDSIYGWPVEKRWYSFGAEEKVESVDVVTHQGVDPVDLTIDDKLVVVPFIPEVENGQIGIYGPTRLSKGQATGDYAWAAGPVPNATYLIGSNAGDPIVGHRVMSTNNLDTLDEITYAYLQSHEPDLTTHIILGKLGAAFIDTMVGLVDPDDMTVTDVYPGSAGRYYGRMTNVGGTEDTSDLGESHAIQMIFPTISQSGIFRAIVEPTSNWTITEVPFPVVAMPATLGWNAVLGELEEERTVLTDYPTDAYGEVHYSPVVIELNKTAFAGDGALAFKTTVNDKIQLTVLAPDKVDDGALEGITPMPNAPYWTMARTAIARAERAIPNDPTLKSTMQDTIFVNTLPGISFNASVDRGAFLAQVVTATGDDPGIVPGATADVTDKGVVDSLRVVSYLSGTDLGATENVNALPILLEFGNLSDAGWTKKMDKSAIYGNIAVPKPTTGSFFDVTSMKMEPIYPWIGKENGEVDAVAQYIVSFEDPATGLPGSIGVIAPVGHALISAGITPVQQPVTNVRITTDEAMPGDEIDDLSDLISYDGTDYVTTTVEAMAFNDDIVYLTWDNPTVPFSGTIIEAFDATTALPLDENSVPLFKVHVAPQINTFPIPVVASDIFAALPEVTFRIRTVTYGTYNADAKLNTMINFNETPYMQALPAVWTEVITAPVDFGGLVTGPNADWLAGSVNFSFTSPATYTITPGRYAGGGAGLTDVHTIGWNTDTNVSKSLLDAITGKYSWGGTAGVTVTPDPGGSTASNDFKLAISTTAGWKDDYTHKIVMTAETPAGLWGVSKANSGDYYIHSNGWRAEAATTGTITVDAEHLTINIDPSATGHQFKTILANLEWSGSDTTISSTNHTLPNGSPAGNDAITYAWSVTSVGTAGGGTGIIGDILLTNETTAAPTIEIKNNTTNWKANDSVTLTLAITWDEVTVTRPNAVTIKVIDLDEGTWVAGEHLAFQAPWNAPVEFTPGAFHDLAVFHPTSAYPEWKAGSTSITNANFPGDVKWELSAGSNNVGTIFLDTASNHARPYFRLNNTSGWAKDQVIKLDAIASYDAGLGVVVNDSKANSPVTLNSNGWRSQVELDLAGTNGWPSANAKLNLNTDLKNTGHTTAYAFGDARDTSLTFAGVTAKWEVDTVSNTDSASLTAAGNQTIIKVGDKTAWHHGDTVDLELTMTYGGFSVVEDHTFTADGQLTAANIDYTSYSSGTAAATYSIDFTPGATVLFPLPDFAWETTWALDSTNALTGGRSVTTTIAHSTNDAGVAGTVSAAPPVLTGRTFDLESVMDTKWVDGKSFTLISTLAGTGQGTAINTFVFTSNGWRTGVILDSKITDTTDKNMSDGGGTLEFTVVFNDTSSADTSITLSQVTFDYEVDDAGMTWDAADTKALVSVTNTGGGVFDVTMGVPTAAPSGAFDVKIYATYETVRVLVDTITITIV